MNFAALSSYYQHLRPARSHIAVPLAMMAALFWLSSLPGMPLPGEPDRYAVFLWIPPTVQNALHVPAYALFGAAWRWALAAWCGAPAAATLGALATGIGYGFFDEWHQSLVPGRFGSFTDVAADAVGAALGVWLAARTLRRRAP